MDPMGAAAVESIIFVDVDGVPCFKVVRVVEQGFPVVPGISWACWLGLSPDAPANKIAVAPAFFELPGAKRGHQRR